MLLRNEKSKLSLPRTAFVVFHNGAFGGGPKKELNLFLYLSQIYPETFYFFVNHHLYHQIRDIYGSLLTENIRIVDLKKDYKVPQKEISDRTPRFYEDRIPDPVEVDKQHRLPRKIYWYYKNKYRQYKLFLQIEKYRSDLGIKVFYAIFSGVLPLVFYLSKGARRACVFFSNIDSWFCDVHSDMKRLWYRRYYSFNYALEHSDIIDFTSPYVYEGVKKLGVRINENSSFIAPCSFIDYSKCSIGDKNGFEIAFCGRLEPEKNPLLYLEAVNEIVQKFPNIKFHILGEGSLVNEVNNFIKSYNLLPFVNFQFVKNPPEILKNTTVFVSLQSHTNYPSQSVLEAMACGNCIIASNRGDTRLFINDSNGLIINLEKDELVKAISKLARNKKWALEMGRNGREFVTNYHTVEKYSDYFLDLVEKAYSKVFKSQNGLRNVKELYR